MDRMMIWRTSRIDIAHGRREPSEFSTTELSSVDISWSDHAASVALIETRSTRWSSPTHRVPHIRPWYVLD